MVPGAGEFFDLANAGIYALEGNYIDAGVSLTAMIPAFGTVIVGAKIAKALKNSSKLAEAGQDLFVGSYGKSKYWNKKSGLIKSHTPHHVVQNAVSKVSHGEGITINMKKNLHSFTRTYRKRIEPASNLRTHLARDIKNLRGIFRNAGYNQNTTNRQLQELIRQNKMLGGFNK